MENCFALLAAHEKIAEDLVSQEDISITRPIKSHILVKLRILLKQDTALLSHVSVLVC